MNSQLDPFLAAELIEANQTGMDELWRRQIGSCIITIARLRSIEKARSTASLSRLHRTCGNHV